MIVDGIDVLALDALQHLGQQARILPRQILPERFGFVRRHAARKSERQADRHAERQQLTDCAFS